MNGESFPFTRSWIPSFMCSSSFSNCWDIFVCCRRSWLKIWNSWSRASMDLWANSDKAMVSLWFFVTADMTFWKRLSTVEINDDRCSSCWAIALASLTLLLLSVCMWRFRALMSSEVAVPKSDLEILPTRSKSPLLNLLDEPMEVRCGGSTVDRINRWTWLTVQLTLAMHCTRRRFRDLMMWPAVLHWGMLQYNSSRWIFLGKGTSKVWSQYSCPRRMLDDFSKMMP